jgi:hypothetical protein
LLLAVFPLTAEPLELEAGFDGSNPRTNDRVTLEGLNRWRIKPFNEEGSNDDYWFRFNVRLVNNTQRTLDAELLVEWETLERHPDFPYDYYFYGDMGNWHPAYAFIGGNTARLTVPCPPGLTYVGYYPRYSYARHQEFIAGLKEARGVEVRVEGQSFQGRDIETVRLGTPGRTRLLVTARNHPYETSCSYLVEDMIAWLRGGSPEAARLLADYDIYFLPMMNPDGVATGCNQRTRPVGGVNMSYAADSDDPSVTALLGAVQRIRPALWTDIHSWPHKGDDGMWCTDKWVADGLLAAMPDSTFDDYVWSLSFVAERGDMPPNHLWSWLMRSGIGGGVSLSFSWWRRNEEHMERIAHKLVPALCATAAMKPQN